ncbi:MAG: hypothetical protein ACK5NN_02885 [Sphingomonadaceae bacterium]
MQPDSAIFRTLPPEIELRRNTIFIRQTQEVWYLLPMAFDLGRAMCKKEEFETSRLMEFEFRRRARATRLLAQLLDIEQANAMDIVATMDEFTAIQKLGQLAGIHEDKVATEYQKCLSAAHEQLVSELGDPSPHRMG